MRNEAQIAALVASIYEAAIDPECWTRALLDIAEACGGFSASIIVDDASSGKAWGVAAGVDAHCATQYYEHFHSVNPIWQRSPTIPLGGVRTDDMIMPRAEFKKTEFFNDFLIPQGCLAMLGAGILDEPRRSGVLAVHAANPFEVDHLELYHILAPHMGRAVQLNRHAAQEGLIATASAAVLDRLDRAVLVVDGRGKILTANVAATRVLESGDLSSTFGILQSARKAEGEKLHKLIHGCVLGGPAGRGGGSVSISRDNGKLPLRLLVVPFSHDVKWFPVDRPVALVVIEEPAQLAPPDVVAERYGLTPLAETKLALEIIKGDGTIAAAERLGITPSTARTQLARLFAKTGTSRQAELVRALLD